MEIGKREIIKPCPFCGNVAIIKKSNKKKNRGFPYIVKCSSIFCAARTDRWSRRGDAIEAWNRRTRAAEDDEE